MSEPVLVIHGIGMRDEAKVAGDVRALNERVGDRYRFIPAYWGDLGAQRAHLGKLMTHYEKKSHNFWHMMADATTRPMAKVTGRFLAWVTRRRGDAEMAEQIRTLSHESAAAMDSRARGYMNAKFQTVRLMLTDALLPFLADVIVYQSHDYRRVIHRRVREILRREAPGYGTPEKPITVLAHSLGGIVAFDMAMADDDPLHIGRFVTFGSQPAFFHVLDPRGGGLDAYDGQPVTLKPTIQSWVNIWDEYDLLAFGVSEVFRLADGSAPVERPIKCFKTLTHGAVMFQGHLGYWRRDPAASAIRDALAQ